MREWFAQEAIASPGPGLPSAHPSELLWCGLLICIFIEQIHHLQTTGSLLGYSNELRHWFTDFFLFLIIFG